MNNKDLIAKATQLLNPRELTDRVTVGTVASALVTDTDTMYAGVCIDAPCALGLCAEHNAVANMITHGESRIKSIVAVSRNGKLMTPCGKCRELLLQINPANKDTEIVMGEDTVTALKELLPKHWL